MATVLPEAAHPPLGVTSQKERATDRSAQAELRFIDLDSGRTWDALVLQHPQYTFFHTAAWARVLRRTYGHTPHYFQLSRQEKPVALLPLMEVDSSLTGRRAVCLPFSDQCGPLVFEASAIPLLEEKLSEMARERKWKYVELRGAEQFRNALGSKPTFYVHELDLRPGVNHVAANFDPSVRRALRKAERSGMAVQISNTRASLTEFFDLHVRTRHRHGTPPQSMKFFSNIWECVLEPGYGFVVLAALHSRAIAGAMFLHFGNSAVYKFGASDERLHEHRGNNLVMWKGIEEVINRGAQLLHFGRTSCDNHGLRRYKRAWGAKEEPISYLRLQSSSQTWDGLEGHASALQEKFFRRMPLAVNRLAGTLLYPHLH